MKTSTLITTAVLSAVSLGMAGAVPLPSLPTANPAFDGTAVREGLWTYTEESSQKESQLAQAISKELLAYRAIATSV